MATTNAQARNPKTHPAGNRAERRGGRRYATLAEAAEYLGITARTVRQMISDDRLIGYRSGSRLVRVDLNEGRSGRARGRRNASTSRTRRRCLPGRCSAGSSLIRSWLGLLFLVEWVVLLKGSGCRRGPSLFVVVVDAGRVGADQTEVVEAIAVELHHVRAGHAAPASSFSM